MHTGRLNRVVVFCALLLSILSSCSTEKDAFLNKGYHNMTARYNGYYNAGVIINEALESYRTGYQEDYSKVIPLDLYPKGEDASAMFPQLEDAIARCSKVVVRHSMPNPAIIKNKKNENCRWIDDNWLVIGRAYYIKGEYTEAEEKLKYVAETEYFRSEEAVHEARIWLAKTYIAEGDYPAAKRVLTQVQQAIDNTESKKETEKEKKKPSKLEKQRAKKSEKEKDNEPAPFPKKLLVDYQIVMAEFYLAQDEDKKAIEHLEQGIKICKNKKRRSRYLFALGQLYSEQGNNQAAADCFDKVAKSNAPYEMRFKAKIRNALSATGNTDLLVKELNKMLIDAKNIEYKDQIYYALAELDVKKPDIVSAKSNFSNSVRWSIKNDRQKGLSYLRLADISFNEKDYLSAQKYYDSCVKVLPKEHEDFESIKNKALGLADLVFHYETVQLQDSLQMLGRMSPKDREKYLEKIAKDIEEKKERDRIAAEQKLIEQQARINNQQDLGGSGAGKKWYFSNFKQVESGFNEFRGYWGQRPLEDNWRRTNKSSSGGFLTDNGAAVDSLPQKKGVTAEDLMKDIPLTQGAVDSSNQILINSLYNLGIIYKEQLKEEKEAISYFQEVIDRNIEHPKVLPSLYQLYLMYSKKADPKANDYKELILRRYPDSEIANILIDPDFTKKKELEARIELDAYTSILKDYRNRSYGSVVTKCNEVISQDKNNKYINKYYLLKAFALSKMDPGNVDLISQPLKELIVISPASEEGITAKMYLNKIKSGEPLIEPDVVVDSPYVFQADTKYFFAVIIPKGTGDIAEIKIKVSNFNSAYYPTDNLSMQDSPMGDDYQLLVVRSFSDLAKAKIYLESFISAKSIGVLGTTASDFKTCVITAKNFSELYKLKDVEAYLKFYSQNY
jgi:tetratricopeptide (TPR) repeat protein